MLEIQEPKYDVNIDGRLFNRETGSVIPDDEPVFILRARDKRAVYALQCYFDACKVDGHKSVLRKRIGEFCDFSINHPDRMREPGSLREPAKSVKRGIDKELRATMPDGSVWAVDVDVIARDRARHYVCRGEFKDIDQSLCEDTIPLFLEDEYSIEDWAENNINWDDIKEFARMVSPPDVNYADGWMNGAKEIVDVK